MQNQQLCERILFNNSDLSVQQAAAALQILGERTLDFGDLFFEHSANESFVLEESIVKSGSFDIRQGVGVRAVHGAKTGFAYSDSLDLKSLQEACKAARTISSEQGQGLEIKVRAQPVKALYSADNPISSYSREEKAAILERLDREARALDPRVTQVMAALNCSYRVVLILDTDGRLSCDIKPVCSISVEVVMEQKGRRERGQASAGGAQMLPEIMRNHESAALAREAVRIAQVNMEALDAPSGPMTVVLGSGWPGVLIHEAVGHGLEGDFNRIGSSAFTGLIGQQVASKSCTIIDDGTLPKRRGSLSCDDEGTPPGHNVLIEKGVLRGYMQDRQNAMLMKQGTTGNGRREAYNTLPLPRMTNTYMLPGDYSKEEIIGSVKNGLYAVNFQGGQVDITSGKFVFSTSEAYLIRDGKIAEPVKKATLIGNGPETMKQVSMVGDDLEFDHGVGACGKAGQVVPVGIGEPTLKIDTITVGGTAQA